MSRPHPSLTTHRKAVSEELIKRKTQYSLQRNLILVVDPVDKLSVVVDVESSDRSVVAAHLSGAADLTVSAADSLRPEFIFS